MPLFSNPAKDAEKIQNTVNYRVLKAAWDCYATLNPGSLPATHKVATPAWFALFSIRNFKGNFDKFDEDDVHLLKSLTTVGTAYDQIINALEENKGDIGLGRHILNTHPNLQDVVPHEYDNAEKINVYIVKVIRQYQQMLAKFYAKYKKKIDTVIKDIEIEIEEKKAAGTDEGSSV